MDDTGDSMFHHLGVNVQRIYNDESVQPRPMDGQCLDPKLRHNRRCIESR